MQPLIDDFGHSILNVTLGSERTFAARCAMDWFAGLFGPWIKVRQGPLRRTVQQKALWGG